MESKKINQLATELTPALSDLTIIGDPTTGISKKITLSQMASLFTGTVEEYANLAAFPLVGVADTIYIALDTNVLYRWDTGLTSYVELSPNIINSLVFSDANGFDGNISLVGSVATLTITTALTTGSVPFIGASGALSQDNANLFFDDTNNRLGINTNAPTTALDVFGSGIIGRLNGTSTNNSFLGFASAGTNKWSIGNVQSDHRFRIYSEANTAELFTILPTGEIGIGIANPFANLHIDGGASINRVIMDANINVAKIFSFRSDNSPRWALRVDGTESGSNAGADFAIRRYTDAGAFIDAPLTITRSTGYSYFLTNVIVGGTAASRKLQVNTSGNDGIRISTSGDNPTLDLMQTAAANAGARNWRIVTNWEGWGTMDFQSGTNNTEDPATTRLSISGTTGAATFSGNVTAGTTGALLTLGTSNTSDKYISIRNSIGNFEIGNNSTQHYLQGNGALPITFLTNATERMRINSVGNISIGANSSAWDTIKAVDIGQGGNFLGGFIGGSALYAGTAAYYGSGSWKYASNGNAANLIDVGEGVFSFRNAVSGSTGSTITWNERLRITNDGNVGINSSNTYSWRLRVVGVTTTNSSYGAEIVGGTSNLDAAFAVRNMSDVQLFYVRGDGLLVSRPLMSTHTTSSGANIYVDPSNGAIYRSTSSIKYKKNVQDYTKGLDEVMKLRPVSYEGKNEIDTGRTFAGLIAEEIHDLGLTEYVQYAEDGTPDALAYQNMVALAFKAIQELKAELEILKAK